MNISKLTEIFATVVWEGMTSGWFRDFAIWNWADLRLLARVELMDKLTEELKI